MAWFPCGRPWGHPEGNGHLSGLSVRSREGIERCLDECGISEHKSSESMNTCLEFEPPNSTPSEWNLVAQVHRSRARMKGTGAGVSQVRVRRKWVTAIIAGALTGLVGCGRTSVPASASSALALHHTKQRHPSSPPPIASPVWHSVIVRGVSPTNAPWVAVQTWMNGRATIYRIPAFPGPPEDFDITVAINGTFQQIASTSEFGPSCESQTAYVSFRNATVRFCTVPPRGSRLRVVYWPSTLYVAEYCGNQPTAAAQQACLNKPVPPPVNP